jgi:hypothetical protein
LATTPAVNLKFSDKVLAGEFVEGFFIPLHSTQIKKKVVGI